MTDNTKTASSVSLGSGVSVVNNGPVTRSKLSASGLTTDDSETYVLVKREKKSIVQETPANTPNNSSPGEGDSKSSIKMSAVSRGRIGAAMLNRNKMSDPIRAKIVGTVSITSGSNAFNQGVMSLSPVGQQDFAAFAGVFDEARVTRVDFDVAMNQSPGSSNPVPGGWAVAWDPSNIGTYGSVPDALTAEYHVGPLALPTNSNNAVPQSETKSGFHHFSAPVKPQRLTGDGSISGDVGGGWFATGTSSANAIVGYVKCTIPALGSSTTSTFYGFVTYTCEFRNRT